eukprot:GHRQ01023901.1.p3 GENE.GHRQ01023901.1~~GHRQ01023901.1.p3  ORF type:complete len:108 (-),score=21.49 GHRQ01023901.1:217-540(-)
MRQTVEAPLFYLLAAGCSWPCPAGFAMLYLQGWLLALVDISEEAAEGIIVHATGIMSSMLPQCQLPEATTNLVPTLAHLHSDELPWHRLLLRCPQQQQQQACTEVPD